MRLSPVNQSVGNGIHKMSLENTSFFGRIIGAIMLSGGSYLLLTFWDTWNLDSDLIIMISVILGILFLLFGGSLWNWINNIDTWS
jgi:hypothetical protein